jgi:hypothetical protein
MPPQFKRNISIDKACLGAYGTMILQVPQSTGVTTAGFSKKINQQ